MRDVGTGEFIIRCVKNVGWDRRIHHQVRKERWKEKGELGREKELGIGKVFGTKSIVLVYRANVDVCANVADS